MSKKAIGWLYFSAIVLQILFTIVFFGCLQNYNAASSQIAALTADLKDIGLPPVPDTTITSNDTYTDGLYLTIEKDQTQQEDDHGGMIISIIFMVLGTVLGLIAWIGALINLSRAQLWAWFILTFFFGGIMILIFLIGGPQPRQAAYALQGQPGSLAAPSSSSGVSPQAYQPPPSPSLSALEILQQRYARGEIDTLTFQQMREML